MVVKMLERTGATVRSWGAMYKAVAQSVILYGSKIWVVTGETLKVLEEFHHWAAQQIMRMTEKCGSGRELYYPSVVEAMETVGFHPIRVCIRRRKATIS